MGAPSQKHPIDSERLCREQNSLKLMHSFLPCACRLIASVAELLFCCALLFVQYSCHSNQIRLGATFPARARTQWPRGHAGAQSSWSIVGSVIFIGVLSMTDNWSSSLKLSDVRRECISGRRNVCASTEILFVFQVSEMIKKSSRSGFSAGSPNGRQLQPAGWLCKTLKSQTQRSYKYSVRCW